MSTPENADVSPWDQIIGHVIDQLQEGVINTGGIQWVSHIAPDFEYLPAGPAGWVYPIFDEFPQGDVAGGFNSEFEFVIHLFFYFYFFFHSLREIFPEKWIRVALGTGRILFQPKKY